ncbi:MAG TPA: carbohydrate binding domain-containing protein [Kofleriaceae bacterium]|jgi:hypothetical protein|nr:carbohydrate binding domain-containing protein [Kofleriaceae bacterium]
MRVMLATLVLVGCSADDLTDDGPNLLRNSNFEVVDTTGWVNEWENHDQNPDGAIVVTKEAHSGARALQWQLDTVDGWEYFVIQHGLALQSGHRYALSGWYLSDADGIDLNFIVRGDPEDDPQVETVMSGSPYPDVIGQWAPFRFEMVLPSAPVPTSWQVFLHSIKFNHAATNLTVDDVQLVEMLPP